MTTLSLRRSGLIGACLLAALLLVALGVRPAVSADRMVLCEEFTRTT